MDIEIVIEWTPRVKSKFRVKICQLTYERTTKNTRGYDSLSSSVVLGDFDQQNQLDIVVTNSGVDNIDVLFRNNNGIVISQITYSTGTGSHPNSLAVGHFNNDNLLDIAVTNYGTKSYCL